MPRDEFRHDVFVSYSRAEEWPQWVEHKFVKVLKHWLTAELGHEARIFLDLRNIHPGQRWPDELQRGLAESRAMVALWSRNYWRSEWCRREYSAMLARAEHLRTEHGVDVPLVFPMRIHDSRPDDLPAAVRDTQAGDIREFADPFAVIGGPLMEGLSQKLRTFCESVVPWIRAVPEDSFRWPLVDYSGHLASLDDRPDPGGQTALPDLGDPP